jgi:hypothetical protein
MGMLEFFGGLWNIFVKLCAVLLSLAFDLAVVIVIGLLIADRLLLAPDLYSAALERQRIYERIPSLAAEQIYMQLHNSETGSSSELPSYLSNLTSDQWNTILTDLLPADWLRQQTNSILQQAFHIINTPGAPLQINISLLEFKNRLAGQAGLNAMLNVLKAMPPCASGQLPLVGDSGMPECRPPDDLLETAKPFIAEGLKQAAGQIPDQLDVLESARVSGALEPSRLGLPSGVRNLLQIGRWLVRFSPLVCLIILLLVALLVVRSWVSLLRWWGGSILSAGISTVGVAFVGWIGGTQAFSILRENLPPTISPSLYDAMTGVISSVILRVALLLGGVGALIAAVGLVMLVFSFFLARAQSKKSAHSENHASDSGSASPGTPGRLQDPPDRQGIFG